MQKYLLILQENLHADAMYLIIYTAETSLSAPNPLKELELLAILICCDYLFGLWEDF